MLHHGVIAGAAGLRAELIGANLFDASGGLEECAYKLTTGGLEQTSEAGSVFATIGTWLITGDADQFEARFNAVGDATTPDDINVWHDLGSDVEFGLQFNFARNTIGTIEIREKLTQIVRASAALQLDLAGP